jgi:hypothetical protein
MVNETDRIVRSSPVLRRSSIFAWIVCCTAAAALSATPVSGASGSTGIRLANGLKIVSVQPAAKAAPALAQVTVAGEPESLRQPPVAGFSPLVAITTSDRRKADDFDFEHSLSSFYTGNPINAPADENFVVGILDTGSVVDLAAGTHAQTLGLSGRYLASTDFPIGGVGGTINARITMPLGVFAAGLGAVGPDGRLDLTQVVGHTNVSMVAAPEISCANGEEISAVIGTPFLAFYTSIVRVDRPRKVTLGDATYISPDIRIVSSYSPPPEEYPRQIPLELGGMTPVSTASYYAFPNLDDILGDMEPLFPTLLSLSGLSIPTGGAFFTEVGVLHGEVGPTNSVQTMRVLVDTGAQSSIMNSGMAGRLNLPLEPDFTAEVCGVGGLREVSGYYVDFVRINALGGALEYARVPFVVLDMESPEGGALDGILGMNFFWNRNIVLEPTVGGGFLHVSDPVPYAYIDLNLDDVVDMTDFAIFAAAWHSTPGDSAWNPDCDFFLDEVIDYRDLEAFVDAWTHSLTAP